MTDRWRVAILTTGRQDFGILRSTLRALRADARFKPLLYVGGMHLSPRFGRTVTLIEQDGFEIARQLAFVSEPPNALTDTSMALRMIGTALAEDRPAALLLVGDRSETLAAGAAATLAGVPIVHLHGGEESEGAIDNAFRHALTKLSHLHLVSHADHAARVLQMGESPQNMVVVGAAGLDHLYREDLPSRGDLERRIGRSFERPLILVTVHPATLGGHDDPAHEAKAVGRALESVGGTIVITAPNADHGGTDIRAFWDQWVAAAPNATIVESLGDTVYWGLLKEADAMVGNSSSGIVEAPAAGVPVVDVGDRQRGRLRSEAVRSVPADAAAIRSAVTEALGRRAQVKALPPIYPTGAAAPRIVAALADWLPRRTLRKTFVTISR